MSSRAGERMSRKEFLKVMGGSALSAATLSACVFAGATPTASESGGDGTAEERRGTLIGLYNSNIDSFNPLTAVMGSQGQFFALVMPGLITSNNEGTGFLPVLAERWAISGDATEYTFHLHPAARWHDGTPVTAEDVEFTYRLYLTPATLSRKVNNLVMVKGATAFSAGETEEVEGIEVIDEKTIKFTTEFPTAQFISQAGHAILPRHILGDIPPDQLGKSSFFFQDPLGSGPFRFVEHEPAQFIRLAANDGWHWGKPKLAGYLMQMVSTVELGQILMERREAHFDAWYGVKPVPEVMEIFVNSPHHKVIALPGQLFQAYAFNMRLEHWADKRVRQAWWYALDRRRLLETFWQSNGTIYNSPLIHPWIIPDDLNPYEYNPDLARQLLKDAGWDADRVVTVNLITLQAEEQRAMVAAEQQMLEDVGFTVEIEEMASAVWVERFYDTYDYDVVRVGFGMFDDPDGFLKFHLIPGGRYALGYADYIGGDFEAKVIEADQLVDQAARQEIYLDIQHTLNDDPPLAVLFTTARPFVFDHRAHAPGVTDGKVVADAYNMAEAVLPIWGMFANFTEWEFREE